MYPMTNEQLFKLGQIYTSLLHVLNDRGKDPYPMSDIFPYKYFVMVLPRAVSIGIPKKVNNAIGEFMDGLDADKVPEMMEKPVPMEKRINFTMGCRKYEDLTKVHPITKLRKEKGMTQTELAERAGVSQKDISRWENFRCSPSVENLKKLTMALECKIDDIV